MGHLLHAVAEVVKLKNQVGQVFPGEALAMEGATFEGDKNRLEIDFMDDAFERLFDPVLGHRGADFREGHLRVQSGCSPRRCWVGRIVSMYQVLAAKNRAPGAGPLARPGLPGARLMAAARRPN